MPEAEAFDRSALETVGRTAVAARDWERALAAYQELATATGSAEAWEGLGLAAWGLQDTTRMLEAHLTAYRQYR